MYHQSSVSRWHSANRQHRRRIAGHCRPLALSGYWTGHENKWQEDWSNESLRWSETNNNNGSRMHPEWNQIVQVSGSSVQFRSVVCSTHQSTGLAYRHLRLENMDIEQGIMRKCRGVWDAMLQAGYAHVIRWTCDERKGFTKSIKRVSGLTFLRSYLFRNVAHHQL